MFSLIICSILWSIDLDRDGRRIKERERGTSVSESESSSMEALGSGIEDEVSVCVEDLAD